MSSDIRFGYGIICDPLEIQANNQGYTLGDKVEMFEKIRDSINMCKFHVATESQVNAMFKKLHNKVVKELKPLEN